MAGMCSVSFIYRQPCSKTDSEEEQIYSCFLHKHPSLLQCFTAFYVHVLRHQADVLHAYHLLKENGIHTSNIVLMVYGDLAFNEKNPRCVGCYHFW